MLHYETVEPHTLELLKDLMCKDYLQQFVLVGGTALALQLGHRKSIDLDLFTVSDFRSDELNAELTGEYAIQVVTQMPQTLICQINQIKVDFIRFKYPYIRELIQVDGIRMAAMEDIAAMKLDAITGRGSKKDFYDLYALLAHYDLPMLLDFYQAKYAHQTTFHVLRSIAYFADAEHDPDPIVLDRSTTWVMVKKRIEQAIQKL